MAIQFGTYGWRGIISDDFTFANVRLVSQAIADYLQSPISNPQSTEVILGHDTRFLSRRFATATAEVHCCQWPQAAAHGSRCAHAIRQN